MSLETKVDLLSERARPIAPLPNVARKAPSLAPARSIDSRRCAAAVMCFYTSPVTSWQPPCPAFSSSSGSYQVVVWSRSARRKEK